MRGDLLSIGEFIYMQSLVERVARLLEGIVSGKAILPLFGGFRRDETFGFPEGNGRVAGLA